MSLSAEVFNIGRVRRLRNAKAGIGLAAVFLVILSFGLLSPKFVGAYDYFSNETDSWDKANITVTINAKTIVDVTPEDMNFGLLDPGSIGNVYNVTDGTNDDIQLSEFEIENLGSTNITRIWLNVTQPATNPFGLGDPTKYDPGNWIAVNVSWIKSTGNLPTFTNTMSFIDRIEFNESKELVYLNTPLNTVSYGRFRVANNEYFWAINASDLTTVPPCLASATNTVMLTLGNPNEPHNVTDTGDINLVDGDEVWITYTSNDGTYSLPTSAVTYNGEEYVVLVAGDCSHIRFVKWNSDAPGATLLSNGGYVFDDAAGLAPGQAIAMNVEARVPYGVVASSYSGWLTVIAASY